MAAGAYQTTNLAYQGAGAFAYQEIEGIAPPAIEGGSFGNWNLLNAGKRKKKKPLLIKFSDFETRDRYEQALEAAARPLVQAVPIEREIDTSPQIRPEAESIDSDDDDMLITALVMRMLH